jgi:hypothetical protein
MNELIDRRKFRLRPDIASRFQRVILSIRLPICEPRARQLALSLHLPHFIDGI